MQRIADGLVDESGHETSEMQIRSRATNRTKRAERRRRMQRNEKVGNQIDTTFRQQLVRPATQFDKMASKDDADEDDGERRTSGWALGDVICGRNKSGKQNQN